MGDNKRPIRVMVQYNCIPHYRARIFELLSQRQDVLFTVLADSQPDTAYLKTVRGHEGWAIRSIEARTRKMQLAGVPALYWQPRALAFLWRERPDVVIALGSPYSLTAWALLMAGRLLGIPVLLWGHGLLADETGPKWWLRRALYRLASGQLLYGERARKLLQRKGFEERTLHVVYNSLDFDSQAEVGEQLTESRLTGFRNDMGVVQNEGLVVFVGRLLPLKRLDMLVRAVGILARRGRRVHAALVGAGSERASLERLSASLGVSDLVHFLGESYDEEFLGLVIGASDLAVIPSYAGLGVVHALAFGTPVLLNDRVEEHGPEGEAVIEGETGFFYRYGDIADLAEKIEKAIFPVPRKISMASSCKALVAQKYNPHRQVGIFVKAVARAAQTVGS